ncbi:RNA polymerase-interacting CarD/CdnL/TRCF family regulator [Bradyrhizobium japonicum]
MTAEKRVQEAVERAQAILARYLEPGERDCERTVNELLDVLDRDEVEVTDAEGRKAAYVPLSRDGKVVESAAVVEKLSSAKTASEKLIRPRQPDLPSRRERRSAAPRPEADAAA